MLSPSLLRTILLGVALVVAGAAAGCEGGGASGELTGKECAKLTRKVRRIETGGRNDLEIARRAGERSNLQSCKARGTKRAYRCVMRAESREDLRGCERHFK